MVKTIILTCEKWSDPLQLIIMTLNDNEHESPPPSPSGRLLSEPYRLSVEQLVSEYYGHKWQVKEFRDMLEFACHPSAILSDGVYSVFVKLSEAAHGSDQFEVELAGLRFLSERAGVLIPSPIGMASVPGGVILVLEAAQAVERAPRQWRDIGRTLARIHQIKGDQCGLETQGYFGPLFQDNRPMQDWLTFYTERRLWPRLAGAINSGNLSTDIIRQVERLIARLPQLGIPESVPTLLHGDAQQNNFISTERGAMVIDPAVYFGNPEVDLAYIDYFQPVPEEVFLGYQEEMPIDPGFHERRDLWRVSAYLAAVEVEGVVHLNKLTRAMRRYL
jgi:protein-ribulosamine 3-kinase